MIKLGLPRNSTTYKVTGADTFRASSTQILDTWGSNLQNVEKKMRRIYVADDGYDMGQVDQAGAEALVVAYLAPVGEYRELFTCGVKPHTFVALHVFADQWRKRFSDKNTVEQALEAKVKDITKVPKWKDLDKLIRLSDSWPAKERFYFIGKKIVHASNYGMMGNTFALSVLQESSASIVLTKEEADRYLATYHKLFPEIHRWHFIVQASLKKNKRLHNLFGFPCQFTGYVGESMFKDAYAWIPQSTVGCITHIAYTNFQDYIETNNRDWHLLANTHDSYLFEAPESEILEACKVGRFYMEQEWVGQWGDPDS